MENVLEVKNLFKRFKNFQAVEDVSFFVKEGEIVGFLGPNGAGKTTTIQMLLGVLTPTKGEILYFGKDLKKNREEILEKINFSSTYTNLPFDLTVKEALNYTSYFYDIKNRKERIEDIKSNFELDDIYKQRISELSSGQLTRLNLAKAFINYPKVLLLDEPTASLDPEIAKYIRDFILKKRKKFNLSILITSHNMTEVEEICDRVIFINNGKIVANDTPENLAKSMTIVHVELMIKDGLKKVAEHCDGKKIKCKIKNRYITVDLEEKDLSGFLDELKKQGISFEEISIQKPTLEDYFLKIASQNQKYEN